ncbi:MAG: type II secretion system F family protein [Planctomycetota bacterium]
MTAGSFRYKAIDVAGQHRRGTISATDTADAYRELAAQGLTPIKLRAAANTAALVKRPVGLSEVAAFTRELSVLLEARIPLAQGIQSIADGEKDATQRGRLRDIAANVEAGSALTDALAKHGDVFGDMYIATIRAAEKCGALADVTGHLAEMLDRQLETKQQFQRALMYPVVVLSVVLLAVLVILMFVVPRFSATFESSEVNLPLITVVIQWIGTTLRQHWMIAACVVGGAVVGAFAWWSTPGGRRRIEGLAMHVPYLGSLLVASTVARFTRVLEISLNAGLDVLQGVDMAARATGRPIFIDEASVMFDSLRRGEPLAQVLQGSRYLPNFARRMLGSGHQLVRGCPLMSCGIEALRARERSQGEESESGA